MAIANLADPVALFEQWFEEAAACKEIAEPTAMTLATVDEAGRPTARVVLLKEYGQDGFCFYTNLGSPKARHLAQNPHAALCFYWMPLDRQVRVEGEVQPVTEEEADAYFATRPRQSQLGAWASLQSQALDSRLALEKRLAKYTARFHIGRVTRPEFWSGFRLNPTRIEFWLKQPYRLHDRVAYERDAQGEWRRQRLYP